MNLLPGMGKRRVEVTARSRRIVGKQETDFPQIVAEMAAPLEARTPIGTAAKAAIRVRMEAWRQWRGRTPAGASSRNGRDGARGAHEALPHTSPGGKPPETPAPFPWCIDCTQGSKSVKVSLRRHTSPPLTHSLPCQQRPTEMRERGPSQTAASYLPLVGNRQHCPRGRPKKRFVLDTDRPSHGSRDRQRSASFSGRTCLVPAMPGYGALGPINTQSSLGTRLLGPSGC